MAVMTDSTSRPEFELATNTALSDFPNVEAKREEQRNCLKHVVGRIDVFAISPTGFGKRPIFQLFPRAFDKRMSANLFVRKSNMSNNTEGVVSQSLVAR